MRNDLYAMLRERIVKVVPDLLDATSQNIKILGRDIQLADVLRAIEETRKTDEDPILLHVTGEFDTYDRKDVLRLLKRVPWDTSLPLHEQSDELGEWLLTILTTSA